MPHVRKQLSNAAATWLNTHKDALLPALEELDDLPSADWVEEDDFYVGVPDNEDH